MQKYGWSTESEAKQQVKVYDGLTSGGYEELLADPDIEAVIIALPLPVFAKNPPSRRRRELLVDQVCPIIRAIAEEKKLPLVDLQTLMAGDVELSAKDGVHFTKQGYEKMSKVFKERIIELTK